MDLITQLQFPKPGTSAPDIADLPIDHSALHRVKDPELLPRAGAKLCDSVVDQSWLKFQPILTVDPENDVNIIPTFQKKK